ncbi:MAG TPA: hypothetical protein PK653_03000, partial [Syntrophales bacterium]|nr:hypothetical protein [Syntrophales bacterium]
HAQKELLSRLGGKFTNIRKIPQISSRGSQKEQNAWIFSLFSDNDVDQHMRREQDATRKNQKGAGS